MSGAYVHLPFCRRRCSYCPFAISVDLRLRDRYFAALDREISAAAPIDGVETLYLGGGTPSLTTAAELSHLLTHFGPVESLGEFTIEANPEDIDASSVDLWRDLGVSRLSVGVQSLHEAELRPLGRLHGRDHALRSLDLGVAAGFLVNADLIIGLPGQTRERFIDSLKGVLAKDVGHLSLYVLDLDEDTPLRRRVEKGRVALPDEDLVVDLYMDAVERCGNAGLEQYEVSNFARPGEESRHNLGYWNLRPYLGFGMGAHSYDGQRRFANTREIVDYLDRAERGSSVIDFEETIGPVEAAEEEIFLSLRQRRGISIERLHELRGEVAPAWLERGVAADSLVVRDGRASFTPRGFILSSELIAGLF